MYVQVVYLPYLATSKEIKTKPAQNATRDLRSMGIVPDLLVARCEIPASDNVRHKLSAFCGVPERGIAILPNARTVYEVPLTLEKQDISNYIVEKLHLKAKRPNLKDWQRLVDTIIAKPQQKVRIGIVAKYLDNEDTYFSVMEALKSAAWHNKVGIDYKWVDAEELEKPNANVAKVLSGLDGIVVPGGFGTRGVEGKIKAAEHALKHKLPYLGLCLGLQVAVIGAARSSGLHHANTTEIDADTLHPVIATMADQKGKENTGGTMRLGNYPCVLAKDSLASQLYRSQEIAERHRHRYECNNAYREQYEKWGIRVVGTSPDNNLVEVIEGVNHPFVIASQFHPEFTSRPNRPQPLFNGFIATLAKQVKVAKTD
jgi:CTP synthase